MSTDIPKEMWEHKPQPKEQRPAYCLQTGNIYPCVAPYCWCKPNGS